MSLDLSALPAKLKDYAVENKDVLLSKVMVDTMPEYMTPLSGVRDEIPLSELVVESIIQPGSKDAFNPQANKVKFKARVGKVRPIKVDLQFTPTQIVNIQKSYYGLIDAGRLDPYTMPFESYIFEKIISRVKNDLRLQAIFKGVYNASGTAPVDTMKGILAIVASDSISGNRTTGAAVTATNAFEEVMKIVEKVESDANYSSVPMIGLISPINFRNYCNDYAATRGSVIYNDKFEQITVEGTNITLKKEPGMVGSDRIIVTPAENTFWLMNEESALSNITVEYALRNIYVMMDFDCAPEIGIMETLWCNNYAGIV